MNLRLFPVKFVVHRDDDKRCVETRFNVQSAAHEVVRYDLRVNGNK